MAGKVSLDPIGQVVLETREDVRDLRTELRGMHEDQTVMIRMLQRREAELDLMRAIDQRYQSLRTKVEQLEKRLEQAGIG
ncbi:MAG: hypothetical protein WAS21_15575 [Geminicoccaceae bacterium]